MLGKTEAILLRCIINEPGLAGADLWRYYCKNVKKISRNAIYTCLKKMRDKQLIKICRTDPNKRGGFEIFFYKHTVLGKNSLREFMKGLK